MSEGSYILPPVDGLPPMPGMGRSILPEVVIADYSAETRELEPIPEKTPWEVVRTMPNKFSVRGGKVYGSGGTSEEITDPYIVETTQDGTKIWVQITHSDGAVTGASFGHGVTVPDDTDTSLYWVVANLYDVGGGGVYLCIEQIENSHIRIAAARGATVNHPFRVTKGTQFDIDGNREWFYAAGDVYTQGGTFNVVEGAVNLESGYLYLIVTRDVSSREATNVAMASGASVPTDDALYQYIPVAYVDDASTDPPLQLLFTDVYLRELMLVENGEFQLAGVAMWHRAIYPLPT